MKIFKTKLYRVTYATTGGSDIFSGRYIIDNDWLLSMINSDKAFIVKIN